MFLTFFIESNCVNLLDVGEEISTDIILNNIHNKLIHKGFEVFDIVLKFIKEILTKMSLN